MLLIKWGTSALPLLIKVMSLSVRQKRPKEFFKTCRRIERANVEAEQANNLEAYPYLGLFKMMLRNQILATQLFACKTLAVRPVRSFKCALSVVDWLP